MPWQVDSSEPFAEVAAGSGGLFSRRFRAFTVGILLSVGVVAFESLGVATILPAVATELGGLGGYGWGLSALMLANIVGTVVAGTDIDRRGPARAVFIGSLVFATGCLIAGLAPEWWVFVVARVLQGLGIGAIMAYAYSLVGIAYPSRLQPAMFAFLSSVWTIPSLVGPVFVGLGLAAGALAWTAGSFVQARLDAVDPGRRARSVRIGFLALLGGEITMGATIALPEMWVGWAIIARLGDTSVAFGTVFGMTAAFGLFGTLLAGRLTEKQK
ncbi:MFS transporter [Subtercola sp. RTI3]|uniref:MFS transporter n=1 Tax=Subtercola sp. RTI3 TaxID=3048639 RepID=UPI002B2275C6|nr:MFS transporter [Subtercola sp. RTI3]MEA9986705.1 MFS transporter [Subtercola sp. RTI3]